MFLNADSASVNLHSGLIPKPFCKTSAFCLSMKLPIAATEAPHLNGMTGRDFAMVSAVVTSFFMVSSIGHPPMVSESLMNRRMMKSVKRSMMSMLKIFCHSFMTPGHKRSV